MTPWLLALALALIVLVCIALARGHNRRQLPLTDDLSRRVMVSLHAVRTRLEVAELKHEIRRDAAQFRRELREQLDAPKKRRR